MAHVDDDTDQLARRKRIERRHGDQSLAGVNGLIKTDPHGVSVVFERLARVVVGGGELQKGILRREHHGLVAVGERIAHLLDFAHDLEGAHVRADLDYHEVIDSHLCRAWVLVVPRLGVGSVQEAIELGVVDELLNARDSVANERRLWVGRFLTRRGRRCGRVDVVDARTEAKREQGDNEQVEEVLQVPPRVETLLDVAV